MHVVIDTNVFVFGLLNSGACRKIFLSFKEGKFHLIISEGIFEELKFILERPKFQLLINKEEREDTVFFIKSHAIFVKPSRKITICRDIKDNKVLECAIEASASLIVTGDKDLLVLNPFKNIPIISPKEFIARLK